MKTYKTNQILELHTGRIRLNAEQAGKRKSFLRPSKGKDIYEITGKVQFISGEIVGLESLDAATARKVDLVEKGE